MGSRECGDGVPARGRGLRPGVYLPAEIHLAFIRWPYAVYIEGRTSEAAPEGGATNVDGIHRKSHARRKASRAAEVLARRGSGPPDPPEFLGQPTGSPCRRAQRRKERRRSRTLSPVAVHRRVGGRAGRASSDVHQAAIASSHNGAMVDNETRGGWRCRPTTWQKQRRRSTARKRSATSAHRPCWPCTAGRACRSGS